MWLRTTKGPHRFVVGLGLRCSDDLGESIRRDVTNDQSDQISKKTTPRNHPEHRPSFHRGPVTPSTFSVTPNGRRSEHRPRPVASGDTAAASPLVRPKVPGGLEALRGLGGLLRHEPKLGVGGAERPNCGDPGGVERGDLGTETGDRKAEIGGGRGR